MAHWCTVLLLSTHLQSVADPTKAFTTIKKITSISNPMVQILNWIFWPPHLEIDKRVQFCLFIYQSRYKINLKNLRNLKLLKQVSFWAVAVSILLYGCTTWMLTKCIEKKLDVNLTRMLCAALKKSWKQHIIKQQLPNHLPPISEIIQVRWTRHKGHC